MSGVFRLTGIILIVLMLLALLPAIAAFANAPAIVAISILTSLVGGLIAGLMFLAIARVLDDIRRIALATERLAPPPGK